MKKILSTIIISSILLFGYNATILDSVNDQYLNKIIFGHGVESISPTNINADYLSKFQPTITIELTRKFSDTPEYLDNLKTRELVDPQVFKRNTNTKLRNFYDEVCTEALKNMSVPSEFFELETGSPFLELDYTALPENKIFETIKRIAANDFIEKIYIEKHEKPELSNDETISPYAWFGSWDNETLPTINGVGTKNAGIYKGSGIKIGVSEAENGITDRNAMQQNYPNLNVTVSPNGQITDHAKRVAYTIAAIAPNCEIISVPSYEEISLVDLDVDIINCSYAFAGNVGLYCSNEARIDNRVKDKNISYVIASGNDGAKVSCPANAPNAITVGATDNNGTTKAGYSNYGTNFSYVKPTIAANGAPHIPYMNDPFHTQHGTSLAAPMVTGTLALLLQKDSSYMNNPEKQIALLAANARLSHMYPSIIYPNGLSEHFGAGMLDIDNTLANSSRAYNKLVTAAGEVATITYNATASDVGKTLRSSLFVLNDDNKRSIDNTTPPDMGSYSVLTYFNGAVIDSSHTNTYDNLITGMARIDQTGQYTIKFIRNSGAFFSPVERVAYAYSIQTGQINYA